MLDLINYSIILLSYTMYSKQYDSENGEQND